MYMSCTYPYKLCIRLNTVLPKDVDSWVVDP